MEDVQVEMVIGGRGETQLHNMHIRMKRKRKMGGRGGNWGVEVRVDIEMEEIAEVGVEEDVEVEGCVNRGE